MKFNARRMAEVAVLAAASLVAMLTVRFPIIPGATFMKYDPSDTVALLAGFFMGPAAGVVTVLLKDALFWLIRDGNPLGPLADFIAAGTFVGVAAWVARRLQGAGQQRASASLAAMAAGIAAGTVGRVVVMAGANFPILYLQFGMPAQKVAALLWPAIIPFNTVKALLNGAFAIVLAAALVRRSPAVVTSR